MLGLLNLPFMSLNLFYFKFLILNLFLKVWNSGLNTNTKISRHALNNFDLKTLSINLVKEQFSQANSLAIFFLIWLVIRVNFFNALKMGIKKMDQLRISEVILKSKTNSHFGRGHKNYKLNGDAFNNNYSFPMLQVRKKNC